MNHFEDQRGNTRAEDDAEDLKAELDRAQARLQRQLFIDEQKQAAQDKRLRLSIPLDI